MVWRETGIMDERLRFVVECLSGDETMVALCAAYGISRKNGYKWLGRYRTFGLRVCTTCREPRSIMAVRQLRIWLSGLWRPRSCIRFGVQRRSWHGSGARLPSSCGLQPRRSARSLRGMGLSAPASDPACGPAAMTLATAARTERGVDWRSQGLVPDPRRLALRTLDGDGCVEPLSSGARSDGVDGR